MSNHECKCNGNRGGDCKCHSTDTSVPTLSQAIAKAYGMNLDKYPKDENGLFDPLNFDETTPTFAAMYPSDADASDYNYGFMMMTNDTIMGQVNIPNDDGVTVVSGICDQPAIIGSLQMPFGVFVPFNDKRRIEPEVAATAYYMISDHIDKSKLSVEHPKLDF